MPQVIYHFLNSFLTYDFFLSLELNSDHIKNRTRRAVSADIKEEVNSQSLDFDEKDEKY